MPGRPTTALSTVTVLPSGETAVRGVRRPTTLTLWGSRSTGEAVRVPPAPSSVLTLRRNFSRSEARSMYSRVCTRCRSASFTVRPLDDAHPGPAEVRGVVHLRHRQGVLVQV